MYEQKFFQTTFIETSNTHSSFFIVKKSKNSQPSLDFYGLEKVEQLQIELQKTKTLKLPPFLPCVVKPNRSGSSIGITVCHSEKDWEKALQEAFKVDSEIIIEKYIQGTEIAVSYLKGKILTPVEIQPEKGFFYDFKRKYEKNRTQYILPPTLSSTVVQKMKDITFQVQKLCQVKTYARLDFIVDENENTYVLEMNTLPGLTPLSLIPLSAKYDGISYEQLIQIILEDASLDTL